MLGLPDGRKLYPRGTILNIYFADLLNAYETLPERWSNTSFAVYGVVEDGKDEGYDLLTKGMDEAIRRAGLVVAQSPVILKDLTNRGLKTKRTVVIPNGYDHRYFFPYDERALLEAKKVIENRHSISLAGKDVIVYTGKLNKWYDEIITIADAVEKKQILLIVGDGPLADNLSKKSNVVMCGAVPISEVARYSNVADVAVFPVSQDCSPIAISEYLAIGKPIVMGKGRMDWLLEDGKNVVFVDASSIKSWQEGIRFALAHKEMMSESNLRLAPALSWEHLAEQLRMFIYSNL